MKLAMRYWLNQEITLTCSYCEKECGIDGDEDLTTGRDFYFSDCCHDAVQGNGITLTQEDLAYYFKEQPGGMEHD